MKIRLIKIVLASIAIVAWSSSAYAGCTKSQLSGTWEAAFSDGNSCRLKINNRGNVVTGSSECFDPSLGSAAPDSGSLPVKSSCLAEGDIVVGGVTIELAIQFDAGRSVGAGRFLVPSTSDKGSVVMVRVP